MDHPIVKGATKLIRANQPVDYLSPGQTYLATPNGKRTTRFDRPDGSSGTFLPNWQVERSLKSGALTVETEY